MRLAATFLYIFIFLGSIQAQSQRQPGGKQWLIKFKSSPGLDGRADEITKQHSRFLRDLKKLTTSNGRSSTQIKIENEFKIVFNGYSLSADDNTKSALEQLPYVEYIREDKLLRILDIESSKIIKAPEVWSTYNATGAGISIAIIDTGVDYNHKDLGGGIGPEYKIKGGFDFADLDNDPMDIHGHGTHVAGIAAANGPGLKGVAPDASVYAYKIYSNEGLSYDSWMIAAIERCFDPDQDPNTDDAVAVANISFGRPVDPYEPLSEAVGNAIAKGLTVVVAAGNDGTFESIYTPGTATEAITVAATDQNDFAAWFSAKGPINNFYSKPDIGAPGVDIYSSWPGNAYARETGTSMAAPHVAGAVALIKQVHPNWTPAEIKAAIMGTADGNGTEDILLKGAGRINVLNAIATKLIVTPADLNLGLIQKSNSPLSFKRALTLSNKSDEDLIVSMTASGEEVGNLIEINFNESVVTIPANSSKETEVTFLIGSEQLPIKAFPENYTGTIISTTGDHTINTPFTFFYSTQVNVIFTNGIPDSVWVIGTESNPNFRIFTPINNTQALIIADGTYDIIAKYDDHIFIRESVEFPATTKVTIDKNATNNKIDFMTVDEDDQPVVIDQKNKFITISCENRNYFGFFRGYQTIYTSKLQNYKIRFHGFQPNESENKIYDFTLNAFPPIDGSITITNIANDFAKIHLLNPNQSEGSPMKVLFNSKIDPHAIVSDTLELKNPLNILLTKNVTSEQTTGSFVTIVSETPWQSGVFSAFDDNTIAFTDPTNIPFESIQTTDFTYELGHTIPTMRLHGNIQNKTIRLVDLPAMGSFKYDLGETKRSNIHYRVLSGTNVIYEGDYANRIINDINGANVTLPDFKISPGIYQLQLETDNMVVSQGGIVSTTLTFNTKTADKNPPIINGLTLFVNNLPTNSYFTGDNAILKLRTEDDCTYAASCDDASELITQVFIRKFNSSDWQALIIPEDFQMQHNIPLPADLLPGYYDLKVMVNDVTKNQLEHIVSPAIFVEDGSILANTTTLIAPINDALTFIKPVFEWTEVNLASKYQIEISKMPEFNDKMVLYSIANKLTSDFSLDFGSTYYWRVRPIFMNTTFGQWSTVGSFITIPDNFSISLLSPENEIQGLSSPITFTWENIGIVDYIFQAGLTESFENPVIDSIVQVTTLETSDLEIGKDYFWRVGLPTPNGTLWSAVFSFSTKPILGNEENVAINYVFTRPNPFTTNTAIVYKISSPHPGVLTIFNYLGQVVFHQVLPGSPFQEQSIDWTPGQSGTPLPSGVYFGKVNCGNSEKSFRMVLSR